MQVINSELENISGQALLNLEVRLNQKSESVLISEWVDVNEWDDCIDVEDGSQSNMKLNFNDDEFGVSIDSLLEFMQAWVDENLAIDSNNEVAYKI